MSTSKNYTVADAHRMGFTDEQIKRMANKIAKMPKHHKFWIGPVGCPQEKKILFRLEHVSVRESSKGSYRQYIKYYLFDADVNRQRAFSKNPQDLVFRILKMIDHWDVIIQGHNEILRNRMEAEDPITATDDTHPIRGVFTRMWNKLTGKN